MTKMSTTNSRELSPEDVPEVAEFMEAEEKFQAFKERHRRVFAELIALAEDRNAKLQAADKEVRSREISCGPFQLLGAPTVKINGGKLYEELGKKNFFDLGGKTEKITTYEVDRAVFERAVASGWIPKDVVSAVTTRTCRYSKPDTVVIP